MVRKPLGGQVFRAQNTARPESDEYSERFLSPQRYSTAKLCVLSQAHISSVLGGCFCWIHSDERTVPFGDSMVAV